ncbi:MAG: hypothetical protein LBD51_09440, partial [Bifidobacteriaceae bacterium]|nr:hypothetical protein [Bifidobacteriaceae bacterium]
MATARGDKDGWRRRLRAARRAAQAGGPSCRAHLGLAGGGAGGAESAPPAAPRWPDLADSPGLLPLLPNPGEAVAAFRATPLEPPTAGLLALLAARGLTVLLPAPGPDRRELAWTAIAPATCALPVRLDGPAARPQPAATAIQLADPASGPQVPAARPGDPA